MPSPWVPFLTALCSVALAAEPSATLDGPTKSDKPAALLKVCALAHPAKVTPSFHGRIYFSPKFSAREAESSILRFEQVGFYLNGGGAMLALVRDQRGRAYLTRAQEGISGGPNRRLLKKLNTNGCIEPTNSKLPNRTQLNEMEVLLRESISESAHKVEGLARESIADGGPGYLVCVAVDEFGKPVFIKAETELKLGAVTHGSGALILHGQLMPKNENPEDLALRKASISGRFVLEDDEGNIFRVRATDLSPDGRDSAMQTMFRCVPASDVPAVDDKERTPSAVPSRRNTIGR